MNEGFAGEQSTFPNEMLVLDIGGEGRHPEAWNLNLHATRTCGPDRGSPIPRLIQARGELIPLVDGCVDVLIAERTPLRRATLAEMLRIAQPHAIIILRHICPHRLDPHRFAVGVFPGTVTQRKLPLGDRVLQETLIRLDPARFSQGGGQLARQIPMSS
jgi:hypothetical protein